MSPLDRVVPYAKAVAAFVTPGVVAIGAALTEGSPGGTSITAGEWVGALIASLTTAGVVFTVPNRTRVRLRAADVPHRADER